MNLAEECYVMDSFALLAYLSGETGQGHVREILALAQTGKARLYLCSINLGEVLYLTERRRGLSQAQRVLALIESLPLQIIEASRDLVLDAAHIKAGHPISYADAFAVAVAQREDAAVLTGDPEFKAVEDSVRVEWL